MRSNSSTSSDSGGPSHSARTQSRSTPSQQQKQQQHQQQRQRQRSQEHDAAAMLDLALFNLSRPQLGAIASELHPTSRAHRTLALSALPHLSLERFDSDWYPTCEAVYRGPLEEGCFCRAAVPDPPIPWRTLADLSAAGGALESMDIRQCQAEPLLAGSARAATAPVLAATLAGLRCLRVTELSVGEFNMWDHSRNEPPQESHKPVQLQCVARLISSCSGLTKLVLETSGDDYNWIGAGFLENVGAPAAAAEEGEEEDLQHQRERKVAKQAGGDGRGGPRLRHLEVHGSISGVLPTIVGDGRAPDLTSCRLSSQEEMTEEDIASLAACSKLQELTLEYCYMGGTAGMLAAQSLLCSSTWTKLVLNDCSVDEDVLGAMCGTTQLRHLDLRGNHHLAGLPPGAPSLQQLTFLDVSGTGVAELPQQLGTWMPQLQVLGVGNTKVAAIPQALQRLTCLRAGHSGISSLAAVEHLTGLLQLQLHGNPLVPPCQQLSLFTALQELSLTISEGSAQLVPCALPLLKVLRIKADDPFRAAGQLVGSGSHLTSLGLYSTWQGTGRTAAVRHLGVLPMLQELVLSMPLSILWAASPWLLQQPQLTSLSTAWTPGTEQGSQQAEQQQEGLPRQDLQQVWQRCGVYREGLPDAFSQLTALRVLRLCGPCTPHVPACVARLTRLSVLQLGEGCAPKFADEAAWAVVGRMPLLRRVEPFRTFLGLGRLQDEAPHLFRGVHMWRSDDEWHSL